MYENVYLLNYKTNVICLMKLPIAIFAILLAQTTCNILEAIRFLMSIKLKTLLKIKSRSTIIFLSSFYLHRFKFPDTYFFTIMPKTLVKARRLPKSLNKHKKSLKCLSSY